MPNWLSAAKRAFQNQPPKEPERFEIRCYCEAKVAGLRTSEPQQVACPTCSHVLLVFPESLYPLPKPLKPKPPKRAEQSKEAQSGASRSVTASGSQVAEGKRSAGKPRNGKSDSAATTEPVAPSESVLRKSLLETKEKLTQVRQAVINRRHFTPLRVVVLLMCLILGLTGYWIVRRRDREQATQNLASALKAGRKALDEDDLPNAGLQFRRAVEALDVLGENDASARLTRQTARELSAANGLTDKSLRELLAEAAETARTGQTDAWSDAFRSSYHDTWVVLDTLVTPLPVEDSRQPTEFLIDFPVVSGENQLVLTLNTRELAGVERDGRPRRMIIAAQLHECVPDPERPGVWRLKLNEKSPFLWTDFSLLEHIGWPRDAALEKLIEEQAQLAGIER